MIEKNIALIIKSHGLKAVEELSKVLIVASEQCSLNDMDQLKRGVGLSIGKIETELLSIIYDQYPDLDDLS